MKELILKANAAITFTLAAVVGTCLAFALEGGSPLQDWVQTAGMMLAIEAAVWLGIGIGCIINHFTSLPKRHRGYIRYSEQYGWTDYEGRRP